MLVKEYDYIFIDSPPVGVVTDASILSNIVDATVLVVASNETEADIVKIAKKRLEDSKANILGVILNKVKRNSYSGYRYDYYGD